MNPGDDSMRPCDCGRPSKEHHFLCQKCLDEVYAGEQEARRRKEDERRAFEAENKAKADQKVVHGELAALKRKLETMSGTLRALAKQTRRRGIRSGRRSR